MTDSSTSGSDRLGALADAGVSIWLDDLSRELIETGELAELTRTRHVVGVTTNPSIFASALAEGERYDDQVAGLTRGGAAVDDVITEVTTDDVRNACDVLREVFDRTDGLDGRVSIEVAPTLAFDTEATIEQAALLWRKVDRPNVLIKVPATTEGLPAITAALGEGVSVNVTLIFGLERYDAVMDAYLEGLEQARVSGFDLASVHSVASFFVSRVDTEVDRRLDAIGTPEALELKGRAAVANARLAHRRFEEVFSSERFTDLAQHGARPQRPLWASTGVKNPDYDDVIATLEREGVDKFVDSWHDLTATVDKQMSATRGAHA